MRIRNQPQAMSERERAGEEGGRRTLKASLSFGSAPSRSRAEVRSTFPQRQALAKGSDW